jgi:hypothetical protein
MYGSLTVQHLREFESGREGHECNGLKAPPSRQKASIEFLNLLERFNSNSNELSSEKGVTILRLVFVDE